MGILQMLKKAKWAKMTYYCDISKTYGKKLQKQFRVGLCKKSGAIPTQCWKND